MAEYIEREAATELLKQRLYETALNSTGFNADAGDVYADAAERLEKTWINEITAADVRPVVRGKWNRTDAYPHRLYCSVCYKTYLKNDELLERWEFPLNFCPNCGADMREES